MKTKINFYTLLAIPFILVGCRDYPEAVYTRTEIHYPWIGDIPTSTFVDENFSNASEWTFSRATLEPDALLLDGSVEQSFAFKNIPDQWPGNWQIEAVFTMESSRGDFEIRWEEDPVKEIFYSTAFLLPLSHLGVRQQGPKVFFQPPLTQLLYIQPAPAQAEVVFTVRKVSDQLYLFCNHQLKFLTPYDSGYGKAISFRAYNGAKVTIKKLEIVSIDI